MRPRARLDPVWLLGPSMLLLVVFFFYPLVYAAYLSVFEWDMLTPPRYVGLSHYRSLFASGEIWALLARTLAFSLIVVAGSMSLGLGLAVALNHRSRLAEIVRGAVFSAYVVSWVSVALLWLWVLDREAGAFSALLRSLGLPTADWLGDPSVALVTLAAITVWKIAGYAMVLFIAGLQDVPSSVLEAAALDGAGPYRRFWRITWPMLRPTAVFVATTSLIASFQVFDIVRVMTQGGPVQATTVFVYAIYEQVFLDLRVGRASAEVVLFFFVLLSLTGLQFGAWRRRLAT